MPPVKLSQARSRNTRAAILETAKALFAARGAAATAIDEVARATGLSKASVFAHFGDRQALLAAIGLEHLSRTDALLAPDYARGLSLHGPDLARVMGHRLTSFLEQPDFARLYMTLAGLTRSADSAAFIAHCSAQTEALADALYRANPWLGQMSSFAAQGAEAHLQQAVVYRLAGWTASDDAAHEHLAKALAIWAAGLCSGRSPQSPCA